MKFGRSNFAAGGFLLMKPCSKAEFLFCIERVEKMNPITFLGASRPHDSQAERNRIAVGQALVKLLNQAKNKIEATEGELQPLPKLAVDKNVIHVVRKEDNPDLRPIYVYGRNDEEVRNLHRLVDQIEGVESVPDQASSLTIPAIRIEGRQYLIIVTNPYNRFK